MISTWQWIELWIVAAGPLVGYVLTSYYGYKLQHRRATVHIYWSWSFLHLQLAVAGLCIARAQALVTLWYAGPAGALEVTDPELAVASWAIAIGLMGHVYLLDRHPSWDIPDTEGRI